MWDWNMPVLLRTVGMALGEISNLLVLVVVYKFKKNRACANASKKRLYEKASKKKRDGKVFHKTLDSNRLFL